MKRRGAAEDENGNEDVDAKVKKVAVTGKEEKKQLNYYAVFIMLLFALPMAFTGFLYAMDFFYPQSAAANFVRKKVVLCYEAANPKKLNEIDGLITKYAGHENKLLAKLSEKYGKYPECRFR